MYVYFKDFDYNGLKVIVINISFWDFGNSKVIRKISKFRE